MCEKSSPSQASSENRAWGTAAVFRSQRGSKGLRDEANLCAMALDRNPKGEIPAKKMELCASKAGRKDVHMPPIRGWGMTRHIGFRVCGAAIMSLLVAVVAQLVEGQSLHSVVEPRARVFPAVGPGVTALKRDSSRRYYILAKPATVVSIYGSDGNLIGQIPNANSHGAIIRYAVDIDLGSDGLLFVADRGANAVEVFNPDGSIVTRIPVVAPTSVVALPDGQFAVTTLTSKHLIQIMDEKGQLVRSFGETANQEDTEKQSLIDWGKIVGGSAGDIYFAFTSLPDPILRKYDRYGYVGYETSVPKNLFETGETAPNDKVEFSLNLTHLSLSDQTTGWISMGSSGDVKFGGGVGTGLSRVLGSGGSFGRAATQPSMWQPGSGNTPGGVGGGTFGGMFSGQVTNQGTQFQFGAGKISSLRGGTRGRNGGGTISDQATPRGAMLQFFGSGTDNTDQYTRQEYSLSAQGWGAGGDTEVLAFTGGDSGPQSGISGETYGGTGVGQDFPLSAAFVYGALFNSVSFRPQGPPGGLPGRLPGGGPRFDHSDLEGSGAKGPDAGTHFGEPHFGPHGRFGAGEADLTATVRVNLGDLGRNSADKPVITASGVDPSSRELWAGIGNSLIHFSQDGNPIEIYYLTMNGSGPLKPSAVLVEPDRFLIAADPWGIFEFARPK